MPRREELLDDGEEAIRIAFDSFQSRLRTGIPGIVTAVDLERQTVSVQPAIQGVTLSPEGKLATADMPLLLDVPIMFYRAGGFAITLPIAEGDECFVKFSDRCIDSWWQSGGSQPPMERRMHDLSDGFAFFAPTSQPKKLGDVSGQNLQIRTEDGKNFIEITPGGDINIEATGNILAKAKGDISITAGGNLALKAGGTVSIESAGETTIEAPRLDVQAPLINLNGIGWATHIHGSSPPPSGPPA